MAAEGVLFYSLTFPFAYAQMYVHSHVCAFTCVCVHLCVGMCTRGGQRSNWSVIPEVLSACFMRQGLSQPGAHQVG